MKTTTAAVVFAAMLALAPATVATAHSVGTLDTHGCHADRRNGDYHCHRGAYSGLHFRSKSDMLKKKAQGYTGEEQREAASSAKPKRGLRALWPFGKSSRSEQQGRDTQGDNQTSDADIAPKDVGPAADIEQRLTVLKDLHDKQLITDEEFSATKRQILSDLSQPGE